MIKEIFLRNGFKLKDGDDLNPYVYAAARELLAEAEKGPEIKSRAIGLYKPPFHYNKKLGWIFDGEGKQLLDQIDETAVLRIRGWGRIGYPENPEQLQDMVGDLIAQALTEFWMKESK